MKYTAQLLFWMVLTIISIFVLLLVLGLFIWPMFGLAITVYICLGLFILGLIEMLFKYFG